ncbi:MAG: UxaA family hydrolase [Candidatus Sumerlaeia bacterium]|nr:UxaA family hydrolase [Candidatus Sumerlaeia bacterium]
MASESARVLLLSENDNVGVALTAIAPGTRLSVAGAELTAHDKVPAGHKIATRAIAKGESVIKYGAPIGEATRAIAAGEHVHVHNVKSRYFPTLTKDGCGAATGERENPAD